MSLVGSTNAEKIWNYFKDKGFNNYACAGILANLFIESGLNPHNLQNTGNKRFNITDDEYVAAVDNGTISREAFIKQCIGFGLCQWTYYTRRQALYDFAKSRGVSIGDLEMQLDFLYKELCESYNKVLSALKSAVAVLDASNIFMFGFERPADQGESEQTKRANCGQEYYDKFAKEDVMAVKMDNTPDSWAEEAVNWAVENKILFGDENGNYKLHSNCTRQEMLIFINRLYKLIEKEA